MKYTYDITQSDYATVAIEAQSEDEANKIIDNMLEKGRGYEV